MVYKEKPYRTYLYDFVALQTLVSLYRTENCSRLSRVFLIRCPWDSNPWTEVLQTCTIDHSVRAPRITLFQYTKTAKKIKWKIIGLIIQQNTPHKHQIFKKGKSLTFSFWLLYFAWARKSDHRFCQTFCFFLLRD